MDNYQSFFIHLVYKAMSLFIIILVTLILTYAVTLSNLEQSTGIEGSEHVLSSFLSTNPRARLSGILPFVN